jgi:hypothetical protein
VPIPSDEEFELYLKQFHPLPPEQMQFADPPLKPLRVRVTSALAAAAMIMLVALLMTQLRKGTPQRVTNPARGPYPLETQPLTILPMTIKSANALLAGAPSFKAAVDAIAVPAQRTSDEKKQSALAVLGKDSNL